MQDVALAHKRDAVLFEVDRAFGRLLAYHIEVALQNDGLGVLKAAGAVFIDDHVVGVIHNVAKRIFLSKRRAKGGDGGAIARAARDL